ncbi:MAG: recombinase family protein, partial [candidate division NC10 bacterium]
MKCAIYARKSTDESGKNKEDTSVVRQLAQAKQFIKKQGWTVAEEHVDDGISGAEFDRRPGFQALLESVKAKRVQVVVTMEPSRLGREMTMTQFYVRVIIDTGCRIFYYSTGEEEKANTATDRLVSTIKTYTDEMERLNARQRVRDAHLHKAQQGYATYNPPYGYTTVRHNSHSEFKVVPEEAEIVRHIFTSYTRGEGLPRLAKQLGEDGVKPPRRGWWPGTIREILRREMYIGKFTWGRTRKEDRVGRAGILVRQDPTVKVDLEPHLRIVPQELWNAVQRRIRQEQALYIRDRRGRLMAKPEAGRAGKHLLAGFARCGRCNGGMIVKISKHRNYACCNHHLRGNSVCTNTLKKRIELVDHAVLDHLANEILQPRRIGYIMAEVAQRLRDEAASRPDAYKQKERQKAKLEREV